jgi:hypothetical protein
MPRDQGLPLRADKPGAALLFAHRTAAFLKSRQAARRAPGPVGGSSLGSLSTMRAMKPQSRRHSTAISASSRGIRRIQVPLVMFRTTLRPSASAAACALAEMAISTSSDNVRLRCESDRAGRVGKRPNDRQPEDRPHDGVKQLSDAVGRILKGRQQRIRFADRIPRRGIGQIRR